MIVIGSHVEPGNTLRRWLPRAKASMTFLGIGTSDTDMSVFAVLIGRNEKAKMSFTLKNGQKKPDIVVSGRKI